MSGREIKTVAQVASWRLCMGCGACASVCNNKAVRLVDIPGRGLWPSIDKEKCEECGTCTRICPGIAIEHQVFPRESLSELAQAWGPVLEVWEGHACDTEIRYQGSSGGATTALALFCIENGYARGVLHVAAKPKDPLVNTAVLSWNRSELVARTGSRYSPAAPCEKFNWILEAEEPCVFIGKPCDVVALRKSQAFNGSLNDKIALAISFFCAGTPTTDGTLEILSKLSVKPKEVKEIRYRGCGWPGKTTVKIKGDDTPREMSYEQAWGGILSKHGQLRCRLCPDSTGEFADIACGDPWYKAVEESEKGMSLILVRTEKGKHILHKAMQNGYLKLRQVASNTLPLSQKSILKRRQNLFGRLVVMRALRVSVPKFKGFCLFRNWCHLSYMEKGRSIFGTLRRFIQKRWFRPDEVDCQTVNSS